MAHVVRSSYAPRMSWGAVLAGCIFALVTYLTLSVLGTAIGASTIDPLREANPVSGLGTGAGIWLALSTLVSIALGAFVAGRLATARGGLHGLLSWAVTSLITTWLVAALASSAVGAVSSWPRRSAQSRSMPCCLSSCCTPLLSDGAASWTPRCARPARPNWTRSG